LVRTTNEKKEKYIYIYIFVIPHPCTIQKRFSTAFFLLYTFIYIYIYIYIYFFFFFPCPSSYFFLFLLYLLSISRFSPSFLSSSFFLSFSNPKPFLPRPSHPVPITSPPSLCLATQAALLALYVAAQLRHGRQQQQCHSAREDECSEVRIPSMLLHHHRERNAGIGRS